MQAGEHPCYLKTLKSVRCSIPQPQHRCSLINQICSPIAAALIICSQTVAPIWIWVIVRDRWRLDREPGYQKFYSSNISHYWLLVLVLMSNSMSSTWPKTTWWGTNNRMNNSWRFKGKILMNFWHCLVRVLLARPGTITSHKHSSRIIVNTSRQRHRQYLPNSSSKMFWAKKFHVNLRIFTYN